MIEWPDNLPLPLIAADGKPQNAVVISSEDDAQQNRRARYRYSNYSLVVAWSLGITQNDNFKTFFRDTLFNGVAAFKIELQYPQRSFLTFWMVRFISGYQSTFQDSMWQIQAKLELIKTLDFVVSPLLGESGFLVKQPGFLDDETQDLQFTTSDGYDFFVKEP